MNVVPRPLPNPPPQAGEAAGSAGRLCPADYSYPPSAFARAADFSAETLYVVGGLYGNLAALAAIEKLAASEPAAQLVFNGDFHWFDAEPEWFAAVERGVAPHRALRGNVESEIARSGDVGAGCGCAYPSDVDDSVVARSNDILTQLRAQAPQAARTRLAALPMHLVAQVGASRIGIVHGDAAALAGWRFAHDALDHAANRRWLTAVRADSHIDLFACTHTCLAALRDFDAGERTVDGRQQRRRRHAEFRGFQFRCRYAHRHDGLPAPAALWARARRPLYRCVGTALRTGRVSGALPSALAGRLAGASLLLQAHRGRAGLRDRAGSAPMKLSIVMPVLNEAASVEAALAALAPSRARGAQVILVDGGSSDGTLELARPLADKVLSAPRGRAGQMNAGAGVAAGDVLLFLHADTRLPADADRLILENLARSRRQWGRFDVRFAEGGLLRLVALTMNLRSRITGIATGDQAIFVRRATFERAGGFPFIALMEDVALSARLKRITHPLCLSARVTASGRRWREHGLFRTILLMWRLRLRYFFGADPARLARDYGYAP